MNLLNEAQLYDFFAEHFHPDRYRIAFRLELLPAYAVGSDGDDFQRWLAGEAEPTWSRKQQVIDAIRDERRAGLVSRRVKVMSAQPTEYERYAAEWGYAYNVPAGEDVRVYDLAARPLPADVADHDFWLLGDDRGLAMNYDERGRFEGASHPSPDDLDSYIRTRDVLWAAATPFESWWAAHPELRRRPRVA